MEFPPYLKEAIDQIDASIFTGDFFFSEKAREELRYYLARWERGLKELEPEVETDD